MGRSNMDGHRRLLFLTTSSDDTKPYMILVALIKGFQNHIGFAIIRASGEEWQVRDTRKGLFLRRNSRPERYSW